MSLNIKNPRVHELARRAAQRTGRTQTSVIEEALSRYLAELDAPTDGEKAREAVTAILADVDRRLADADRVALSTDDLYDDHGLPA
jgi:antitoxin VapB